MHDFIAYDYTVSTKPFTHAHVCKRKSMGMPQNKFLHNGQKGADTMPKIYTHKCNTDFCEDLHSQA